MSYSNSVHIFDLFSQRWLDMSPEGTPPPARNQHSALMVNDHLYIVGGGTTEARMEDIWYYGLGNNTWGHVKCGYVNHCQMGPDGQAVLNQLVYYSQGNLVILGGFNRHSKSNHMVTFNVTNRTTSREKVMMDFSFLDGL